MTGADRTTTTPRGAPAAALAACLCLAVLTAAPARAVPMQAVRAEPSTPFVLQIVHLNDFHARFEPVSEKAAECKPEAGACVGGLARVAAAIAAERDANPEALVLNGGDNFQGTLWYNLFKANASGHFMKELPWDALTIGNHEFDDGIAGLTPFLEEVKTKAPFVIANMDDSAEPRMKGLWVPSVVVEKGGRRVGIVGYIWKDTPTIARTEKLVFSDELEALDAEAARLKASGVDIIVALSHAGIDVDLDVAKKTQYADVIVGAHSHTLLYNGDPPGGDHAFGGYPQVVRQQESGRTVLVVQAAAYTKYLGNLTVTFDERGEVQQWTGNAVYLGADKPQDEAMVQEMVPWKAEVEALGRRVVGSTLVELDKLVHDCYVGECTLGNFVADAMVDYYVGRGPEGSWTAAAIGFINAGGLRANIEPRDITYSDLVEAQPFGNTVDLVQLQGRHLLQMLEDSVNTNSLLHWSGVHVVFDYDRPAGRRVVTAEVLCAACRVPEYAPIDPDAWYSLAAPSFVVEGGDNVLPLSQNYKNRTIGPLDVDVFQKYLVPHSPLTTELDGRIVIHNAKALYAKVANKRIGRGFQRRDPGGGSFGFL